MCILFKVENDSRKVVLRCIIKKYSAEVRSEKRKILYVLNSMWNLKQVNAYK